MLFLSIPRPTLIGRLQYPQVGIELRLDRFPDLDLHWIQTILQTQRPVMLTFRKASHGGQFRGSELEREALIERLLALKPPFFDLEYDMRPAFLHSMIERHAQTQFILSYHNFTETPSELDAIYHSMREYPAFSYKIAAMARSTNDALRMLLFVKTHPKTSAICMGEKGRFARVLGPVVGNLVDYASIDDEESTGPGQLSMSELMNTYHYSSLNTETSIYALIGDPIDKSRGHLYHNAIFHDLCLNAVYTESDSKIRQWQEGAPNLSQAKPTSKQFNLHKLNDADGLKGGGCPTQPEPIFESRAVYVKMSVTPAELPSFIPFAKALGVRGLSVTMPLKEKIVAFVDRIAGTPQVGALNTLRIREGLIEGTNTDGLGALDALGALGMSVAGKKVVLLGAGGAARAIAYEAKLRGAHVLILNRTVQRAELLAMELGCAFGALASMPAHYDILVNCTSHPMPIDPQCIQPNTIAMDITYSPRETSFLKEAALKGCQIVYGEEMFVCQAQRQTAFWGTACGNN